MSVVNIFIECLYHSKIRKHAKFCFQVRDRQTIMTLCVMWIYFRSEDDIMNIFSHLRAAVLSIRRDANIISYMMNTFCGTMNQIRCLKIEKIDLRRQKQLNDWRTAGRCGKWWYVTIRHPATHSTKTWQNWSGTVNGINYETRTMDNQVKLVREKIQ